MKKLIRKIYPAMYGIFGSLGLLCCANIFLDLDYKISEHPYAHPFCIIAGIISLVICMTVFCFDVILLTDEEKKLRQLFTEFAIIVISFSGFLFIWSGLWEIVSKFIAYMGW